MIQCSCSEGDGTVITALRWWYGYDGISYRLPRFWPGDNPSTPYFIRDDNRKVTLVIPTFNDSYNGNYTCTGRRYRAPISATITLTIGGELFVNRNIINPTTHVHMVILCIAFIFCHMLCIGRLCVA